MQDLKERTFQFAVRIGKFINSLSYNQVNKAYSAQLVRCSSSVGANYRAAKRAKSTPDFLNKLKIVEEECDEAIYFLEPLKEFNPILNQKLTIQLMKQQKFEKSLLHLLILQEINLSSSIFHTSYFVTRT